MAMAASSGGGVQVDAERDADDRRHARAADHLHGGRRRRCCAGFNAEPPQAAEPEGPSGR